MRGRAGWLGRTPLAVEAEQSAVARTASSYDLSFVASSPCKGDEILRQRGIAVIPDVVCNAGGVIVSCFEWLQNKQSEYWELDEVDRKLHAKITTAYDRVRDTARQRQVDWRTAVYIVALTHLETVYKERGIFP
jgi:glutamate dehydrogenase (NAD(P)+)